MRRAARIGFISTNRSGSVLPRKPSYLKPDFQAEFADPVKNSHMREFFVDRLLGIRYNCFKICLTEEW